MRRIIDNSANNIIGQDVISCIKSVRPVGLILFILNIAAIVILLSYTFLQPIMSVVLRNNDSAIESLPLENIGDNIEVNNMSELDGYSKEEVYSLRKHYVYRSMFKSYDYEPKEEVFGGIQDGKYWYGTENLICYDKNKDPILRAEGNSYVSRLINNPSMLIGLDLPYVWNTKEPEKYKVCRNKQMLFIPSEISYSKDYNMITAKFKINKNVLANDRRYMLNGLNARDLGFQYGYVYNTRNIRFEAENTAVDREIYSFPDYIGVGYSCGIKGGCNNLCPMQENMMFYFNASPAVIDFKLWKERPANRFLKPDIYYRMIFTK